LILELICLYPRSLLPMHKVSFDTLAHMSLTKGEHIPDMPEDQGARPAVTFFFPPVSPPPPSGVAAPCRRIFRGAPWVPSASVIAAAHPPQNPLMWWKAVLCG